MDLGQTIRSSPKQSKVQPFKVKILKKMKYEEVQEILDRYWEGETTLEEERRIKAYFNGGQIDARLSHIGPMFQAIREEQSLQLVTKAKAARIRPRRYLWAIAASLALLLTAGWWMFRAADTTIQTAANTIDESSQSIKIQKVVEKPPSSLAIEAQPAQNTLSIKRKASRKRVKTTPFIDSETAMAMAEIKAALALVSSKLYAGRNEAIKGATYLERMEKIPKRKTG